MVWVIIWLIIAIVAAIGEVATTGLFLAVIAAAAILTAGTAAFLPLGLQGVIFAVASFAGIGFVRPILVRALGMESQDMLPGGVSHSHLIGRHAVATTRIDPLSGQIRIGQGEFWTARPYNDTDIIEPGSEVEILLVEGLTALVAPVAPRQLASDNDAATQKGQYSWTQ